jgi:hypothetical protein
LVGILVVHALLKGGCFAKAKHGLGKLYPFYFGIISLNQSGMDIVAEVGKIRWLIKKKKMKRGKKKPLRSPRRCCLL